MKKISVLGCGWLGFPLAKNLISQGNVLKGSTTSSEKLKELVAANIQPFKIILNEDNIDGDIDSFLGESDLLIINIPPRLRRNPNVNHVAEIQNLIPHIESSKIEQVVFVSSTSVFKDEYDFPKIENDSVPNSEKQNSIQLRKVEQLFRGSNKFKTTIIRCAGLFDEKRHPGFVLSGKTYISNPEAPINLVHKNDVISVISSIIKLEELPLQINLSYPYHPTKKSYYTSFCETRNLALPKFDETQKSKGKIINSKFVERLLDYSWQFKP